jgi:hypothetical protein
MCFDRRLADLLSRPLALLLLVAAVPSEGLAYRCGVQRWPVKTGTDSDIGSVNLTQPTPTTIDTLINLAEPADRPQSGRVTPIETTVWTFDATLTLWKWENDPKSGDWDYHLVFSDADGHTMGGEIPFPDCVNDSSPLKNQIAAARQLFDANVAPLGHQISIPVRVTGIGFFDLHSAGHNPTGSAPNGIELHPILELILNPSGPQPTPTPVPSPTPIPAPTPLPVVGPAIVNGGFEIAKHSGMTTDGWTATRTSGPQHNVIIAGGSYPNSGSNYAQLGGHNRIDEVLAQTISVPTGHSTLSFAANVVTTEAEDADAYDFLKVEIRDSQNHMLATVATLSNQDFSRSNDDPGNYFQVTVALFRFAGQTVVLAFHCQTDNAAVTTFRIDDVSLN